MTDHDDPVDAYVRRAARVGDEQLVSLGAGTRAKQALFEEVLGMPITALAPDDTSPVTMPAGPPSRWNVRGAALAAAAAAAAAILIVVIGVPFGGASLTVDAAAAATLNETAEAAAAQPAVAPLGEGQYRYERVEGVSSVETDSGTDGGHAWVVESWIAADGSGRVRRDEGGEVSDVRLEPGAASPAVLGVGEENVLNPVEELPTDPDALYQRFEAEVADYGVGGRPKHQEMFVLVGDVLRSGELTPQLRSALYQVAARIPGVQLIGATSDPMGRPGVAVGMDHESGDFRDEYIFDPATGVVLAERRTLLRPVDWTDIQPGELVRFSTTTRAVVNSTQDRA